jgi:hypothetical protein
VDLGIRPIHELAIHPDLLDLGDRHLGASSERVAGRVLFRVLARVTTG